MVWVKTVKFQAAAKYLACAKDMAILGMAGRYKQPVQYGRRVRPYKAGRGELILHLETTCSRFNINEEENMLISGTREKSAVADSAEPKQ
jgi:hypothetical protein